MTDEKKRITQSTETQKLSDRRSSSKRWLILILVCISTVKTNFFKHTVV